MDLGPRPPRNCLSDPGHPARELLAPCGANANGQISANGQIDLAQDGAVGQKQVPHRAAHDPERRLDLSGGALDREEQVTQLRREPLLKGYQKGRMCHNMRGIRRGAGLMRDGGTLST